jgi:hypothetical protein
MTWTLSISCLSSVVDYEENLFERFDRNAPHESIQVNFRSIASENFECVSNLDRHGYARYPRPGVEGSIQRSIADQGILF